MGQTDVASPLWSCYQPGLCISSFPHQGDSVRGGRLPRPPRRCISVSISATFHMPHPSSTASFLNRPSATGGGRCTWSCDQVLIE